MKARIRVYIDKQTIRSDLCFSFHTNRLSGDKVFLEKQINKPYGQKKGETNTRKNTNCILRSEKPKIK